MALKKLNVIMGECESIDDVLELLHNVARTIMPEEEQEAMEKAAAVAAKIGNDLHEHQFVKHADVSEYNKLIAKAFPEQVEEKKQECSQDCKHKDKHKG